jgi:hypothetical protein
MKKYTVYDLNSLDFTTLLTPKYAVYTENHGVMRLAEDGFTSRGEASDWAAEKFGLDNWRVVEYEANHPLELSI